MRLHLLVYKNVKLLVQGEILKKLQSLVRATKRLFAATMLGTAVRSRTAAALYYWINGSFDREMRAVARASLNAIRPKSPAALSIHDIYTLRRSVHRIEKGLIMDPRRSSFAEDYIESTVHIWSRLVGSECRKDVQEPSDMECNPKAVGLADWSTSVLFNYFDVVEEAGAIRGAKEVFNQRVAELGLSPSGSAPIPRVETGHMITLDAITRLCVQRRSVRWYADRPVPRGIVEDAVRVASLSPSACNRQPFRFVIFNDAIKAAEVAEVAMGTRGFSHQFPCVAVLVGDLSAYSEARDRHVIYVDGGLAAMSFLLGLEVQGVSSCCINWPDVEERERRMGQLLGLGQTERPVMLISFGYAREGSLIPFSQKKSVAELAEFR